MRQRRTTPNLAPSLPDVIAIYQAAQRIRLPRIW